MADAAPVLIWETDESGLIFLNSHYLEFFGASFDTVRAMGWAQFLHPEDAAGYEAAYREAFSRRKAYTYECRFRRCDGQYRWLRNSGRPIHEKRFVGCSVDVTDLKRTQLALRASQAHVQQILDTAAAGLTRCSRDLRYVSANRAYAEIAGIPVDQIVGHPILEVMGSEGLAIIRPFIDRVLNGETVQYESEVPFRVGGSRFLHVMYTPWRERDGTVSGWVASITDISDRKRVDMALRASEERLRALIGAIPQMVWTGDSEGRCDFVSPQWLEYTGLSLPQCMDDGWAVALHQSDREAVVARWREAVARASIFDMEMRVRAANGSYRWFKVRGVPIYDTRGHVRQWFGTATDITDLMSAREAQQKVEQQLREGDRRKDEFLAMLAHELRNPLAVIANAGEILAQFLSSESRARIALQMLRRQTKQLSRLVDDLLDTARIAQGRIQLEDMPVAMDDVVDQAVETVEQLAHERSQHLQVIKPSVALYVRGDRTRLVQCVGNILHNAVRYTEVGGGIELSVGASEQEIVIAVRDTGAGISPEFLPHVFDTFMQDVRTLDRARGGLGVGLTLVKRVVAMHHGSVQAESGGVGQGATFTIRLPRLTL
jgi:PAS domain S-box-containing protein